MENLTGKLKFKKKLIRVFRRVQHLGCPSEIHLEKSKHGQDQLLVSTSRNVVGSIDVNSGEIGEFI